jgi:predicted RNA-binding Zn-ribbon protein involved in translation (DUF1610 family)
MSNDEHAQLQHVPLEHTSYGPCPTCGTNMVANRCDVCGHQVADT